MRYWQIDATRGVAVVLMVLFNYSFALYFLGLYRITENWLFWFVFPRLVAGTFILIAGLSFTLSYSTRRKKIRRGTKLFALGLLITAVTWLFYPDWTILFGILHLLGLSIILGVFFVRFKKRNLSIGLGMIAVGIYLSTVEFDFSPLFWLVPSYFQTFDYFPLLPWFGVFLLGMSLGSFKIKHPKKEPLVAKPFTFLGSHSLIIYLLHQVLLLAVLFATGLL